MMCLSCQISRKFGCKQIGVFITISAKTGHVAPSAGGKMAQQETFLSSFSLPSAKALEKIQMKEKKIPTTTIIIINK